MQIRIHKDLADALSLAELEQSRWPELLEQAHAEGLVAANFVFNRAKGAAHEKIRDGAGVTVALLKASGIEADDTLNNAVIFSGLVSGATDEATDGSYARKTVANGSVTITQDDTNNWVTLDIADQTWTALAGGAISDAVVSENVNAAANDIPLTLHDFSVTPDSSDVTATTTDFYKAA